MKLHEYPAPDRWGELCRRPEMDPSQLLPRVHDILQRIREEGKTALRQMTAQWDGCNLAHFELPVPSAAEAAVALSTELAAAIRQAKANIETFHAAQTQAELRVKTMPGVECRRRSVPIRRVGLYIPGGSAPLFSSLLMLGVPARLAGCEEIVVCTPPGADGRVHPAIVYVAALLEIPCLYRAGGAQAIAAMAYGNAGIPQVDKIFGPGNQYVTLAKQLVQQQGTAIDMPAGPSEVLVIADHSADPDFVAADLLSQAEHGPDSQVLLVTTDPALPPRVLQALETQLSDLPRADIAREALQHSRIILLKDLQEAMDFSNQYAPEHLILAVEQPDDLAEKVRQAGSVFLGHLSCESAGDYASGTNHTLPTNGYARNYSGVSLDSFVNKITFQRLKPEGLRALGPAIEAMAAAEQLEAHRRAVSIRLKKLNA